MKIRRVNQKVAGAVIYENKAKTIQIYKQVIKPKRAGKVRLVFSLRQEKIGATARYKFYAIQGHPYGFDIMYEEV